MTLREKAICEIATGVCFCVGDERKAVYEYASELIGRPIFTHELFTLSGKLKDKAIKDFAAVCLGKYKEPHPKAPGPRYTRYDSELERYVVPCFYKADGSNISFLVKTEPAEKISNNRSYIMLAPPLGIIFGEVIDKLAYYENQEDLKE